MNDNTRRDARRTTADRGPVWLPWDRAAFSRAQAEGKPVLLSLHTAWCPWCRRMDAITYQDAAVVAILTDAFVPIRVDADRRPDIFDRYALGGVPSTVVLTAGGEVLTGGTFVEAEQLCGSLTRVAREYARDRSRLDLLAAEQGRSRTAWTRSPECLLDTSIVVETLMARADVEFGGFGSAPKLPDAAALRFLLEVDRDPSEIGRFVVHTLERMAAGLEDAAAGGFFRSAANRDWSSPAREKLLDVNAQLIPLYLHAWGRLARAEYRDAALRGLAYVDAVLADSTAHVFYAGEFDEDSRHEPRGDPSAERAPATGIDRTVYTDANAAMAGVYLEAAVLLESTPSLEFALQALERVLLATYVPGGGVAHVVSGDASIRLLADNVAGARALIGAYRATDRVPYLELAQELMLSSLNTFWDDALGLFADRSPEAGDVGLLRHRLYPVAANADAAVVLVELAALGGEHELRANADRVLRTLGPHGSNVDVGAYGRALVHAAASAPGKRSRPVQERSQTVW